MKTPQIINASEIGGDKGFTEFLATCVNMRFLAILENIADAHNIDKITLFNEVMKSLTRAGIEQPKEVTYTLADLLRHLRNTGEDTDLYVDGIGSIAYCGTELTPEGLDYYREALALPVNGEVIQSDNEEDYDGIDDEEGALWLAWRMLWDMAGYCPCSHYDKMFKA